MKNVKYSIPGKYLVHLITIPDSLKFHCSFVKSDQIYMYSGILIICWCFNKTDI